MEQAKQSILAKNKTAIAVAVSVGVIAAASYAVVSGQSISNVAKKGIASVADKEGALVIGEIGYVNDPLIAEKKANKEALKTAVLSGYSQIGVGWWHHTAQDDDRVTMRAENQSGSAPLDYMGYVVNNAKYIVIKAEIVGKDGCADASVNTRSTSREMKTYDICLGQSEEIRIPVKALTKDEVKVLNKSRGWQPFNWIEPAPAN